MDKAQLRDEYKKRRLAMPRGDVINKSRLICRKLLKDAPLAAVKNLSVYEPIGKLSEVDTSVFTSEIRRKYPEIKISSMSSSKNQTLLAQKFDLIIVPVLAFDKDNYRLGWGGGWYDRFLAEQPQAMKIGLSYQNGFIEAGLPHEPHDIPLNKVITEV